jgi:transcriptional regulator GlxA family with amidase domain
VRPFKRVKMLHADEYRVLKKAVSSLKMAAHARMSERTFARRFPEATGTTPSKWLLEQRLLAARQRLETSNESVERVARECGLGTEANMRLHFKRSVGVSPSAYRRAFGQ